jgi:hypothetical protein
MKTGEVMKRLAGLLQRNYALKDLFVKVRPCSATDAKEEDFSNAAQEISNPACRFPLTVSARLINETSTPPQRLHGM